MSPPWNSAGIDVVTGKGGITCAVVDLAKGSFGCGVVTGRRGAVVVCVDGSAGRCVGLRVVTGKGGIGW
jgi:hypothetical protein